MDFSQSIISKIDHRMEQLDQMSAKTEKALKKAPTGSLRASHQSKSVQYYKAESAGNGKYGYTYLKKSEHAVAKALAQREYDERALSKMQKERYHLNRLKQCYQNDCVDDLYGKFPLLKQELIEPLVLTDAQFVNAWRETPYHTKGISADVPPFLTENGEHVRSKSEILIANLLKHLEIPYRYECPLTLDHNFTIHPDFTLLSVARRKEIYFEHLGMMDDLDYLTKALKRVAMYERNGYYPGDQLLISFETKNQPLDLGLVEAQLRHFVL